MRHPDVTPVSRVAALAIGQWTVPQKGDAPPLHSLAMSVEALATCPVSARILSRDDGGLSNRQGDTGDGGVAPAALTV